MQIKWKDPLLQEQAMRQSKLLPKWCFHWTKTKVLTLAGLLATVSLVVAFNCYQPSSPRNIACVGEGCLRASTKDVYKRLRLRMPGAQRRLPQCLIVGARKAGTRALLQIMNIHPLIMAAGREQHFFDDDDNYAEGIEYYRKQMPYSFNGSITIEKTPAYLHTDAVPERVKKMNASIKLLVILRDPVERSISDYVQIKTKEKNKNGYKSFEECVYNYDTNSVNVKSPLLHRSIYVRHVQNWLRYFPLDQFHFVDGKKIVKDPQDEITAVEDFLNLPHRIDEDNLVYNSTKGYYCFRNESINGALNPPRCLNSSKGRSHPNVDPEVMRALRQYFKPFNEKLFHVIRSRFDWATT